MTKRNKTTKLSNRELIKKIKHSHERDILKDIKPIIYRWNPPRSGTTYTLAPELQG